MWLHDLIVSLYGEPTYQVLNYIFRLYPIWLPLILFSVFFQLWLRFRRAQFVLDQGKVMLEIKIPREISKSPQAMEIFLTSLYQTGSASYAETYIDGKVRPWFSLEMVSLEGKIHFYIWAHKKFKSIIEAQIYAQYPSVEITDAEDYTQNFTYDPEKHSLWGTYFELARPQAIPIKTYIDYGLDKDPKEEYKIDPLTSTLEFLGSIGKGEQLWIQILIQAHKKTGLKEGEPHLNLLRDKVRAFFNGTGKLKDIWLLQNEDWQKEVTAEIKKINEKVRSPDNPTQAPRRPTKGEMDTIAAMERRTSKYPFEVGFRGFYIATKESFRPIGITGLIGSVRQYSTPDLNGFKPSWFTDHVDNPKDFFRYFFKKTGVKIRRRMERKLLDAYKQRSFFQHPYKGFRQKPYILTTEELATIYHFPGEVSATPGFERIPSKKAQAPADLPI